jgi:hypothetical protein
MNFALGKEILVASPGIFSHRVGGRIVYVKKSRRRKNPLGFWIQKALHRLTANPLLSPPPGPGRDSAGFEADRLKRLAALGVPVPRVLHRGDGYFVMSDTGIGLNLIFERNREKAERLLSVVLSELRRLHDLGQAHGGSQARNITILKGKVHFIDFEDDIGPDVLADFQLRDLFLFLHSLECLGADPDLSRLCRLYDPEDGARERLFRALAGLRLAKMMASRLFSPLAMRDIRGLIRLIDKAGRLSGAGASSG